MFVHLCKYHLFVLWKLGGETKKVYSVSSTLEVSVIIIMFWEFLSPWNIFQNWNSSDACDMNEVRTEERGWEP